MDKKRKTKIKNISLDILGLILSIPTATVDGYASKGVIVNELKYNKTLTSDVHNWISTLKQRGYLEERNVAKNNKTETSIRLTNKAKLKVLDKISSNIKKDGKYRFVSFDIPEDLRVNRDKFRNALKSLGFKKLQASLWVINKNVGDHVEMVVYEYEVERFITYIISEKTDIDGYLKKMFTK